LGEYNPLVDNQISLEDIIKNPKEPRNSQDPIHLDIFAIDDNGVKADVIWTVWVSFRHEWNADLDGHYCHLTQNVGDGGFQCCDSHGKCHVHAPQYKCFKADWSEGRLPPIFSSLALWPMITLQMANQSTSTWMTMWKLAFP